ncbi:uncharacterized protein LOC114294705 isoform X2 [Camellia sinensis]|uniref:uncharacterized protein LOC114294705 isoform X2 n=1 Tax=Camellia sinensis TaxID=4442 RepID=UPI001035DB97|nr:uncharacterized protein LOC114294705 isoform X2 [Camellia sinensis]
MNPLFGTGKKGADMDFLFATLKVKLNPSLAVAWLCLGTDNQPEIAEERIKHAKEVIMLDVKDRNSWYKKCNRVSCSSYCHGFRCLNTYIGHPRPCDRSKWICCICNNNCYRNCCQ